VPALLGALLVAGCAASGATVTATPAASTPAASTTGARVGTSTVRTARTNRAAARRDAAALLRRLVLPAGTVVSPAEPAGDGHELAQPFAASTSTDTVDQHAWWVVPGTPAALIADLRAHPPRGATVDQSGSLGNQGVTVVESLGFAWPPINGVLRQRWLVVEVTALAGGSTGVRADAQDMWITPRPASERIPRGIDRLVVTDVQLGRTQQVTFTVTSARRIARARALIDALPLFPPGVFPCPVDMGTRIGLSFFRGGASAPAAVATVDPGGCGTVALEIGGRSQPQLAGGAALVARLERALGVRLVIGPPQAPVVPIEPKSTPIGPG
jgi:hypothetical protein